MEGGSLRENNEAFMPQMQEETAQAVDGSSSDQEETYIRISGGECIVTGGTILAFGGSSMTEEFSSACTQCAVLYNLDSTVQAGNLFRVMNGAGEEILSYTPECSFSSVAFSMSALTVGETYAVFMARAALN